MLGMNCADVHGRELAADVSGRDGDGQLAHATEDLRPVPPCPAASLVVR